MTNKKIIKSLFSSPLGHQGNLPRGVFGLEGAMMTPEKAGELIHDLETHQIELRLQNEELLKTQNELIGMRDQYSELYESAPVGYFTTNESDLIIQANLTLTELLDTSRETLLKRKLSDFIVKDDQDIYYKHRNRALKSLQRVSCELTLRTSDKRLIWVRLESIGTENAAGKCNKIRSVLIDITERKEAANKIIKLSRALESGSSAVFITDTDSLIEYVNQNFTELTGYSEAEVIGKTPALLKSGETPRSVYVNMWETISSGKDWKAEIRHRKKDGSLYWIRESISPVKDDTGEIIQYITFQDDITHEYELTEQLNYQASHDVLTGLINRREFERRAERLLFDIQQDPQHHAMCFLDLDQFKVINDTCGHAAGDELLRQLAQVLHKSVRTNDTLARLGGDEFGVLIEHCSLDQAHRVADAIRLAVEDYQFLWQGQTFRVGVSIGLVGISEDIFNFSELLKHADAACYMAKDLGRNRVYVYRDEDLETAQRHGEIQWVARINNALDEDRFCLYAQRITPLDSSSDNTYNYEILLRMIDEKGKVVQPGAFLPAAERYGLMEKLDLWVISHAFNLFSANPDFFAGNKFISINLSGQAFTNAEFLKFIVTQLNKTGIDNHKICFEITETMAIANLSTATAFISTLKKLGCRFALDDFGSGLSSFGYLKNLSVDYLKIDGMFIKGIVDDPMDKAMVKAINEIGHIMGIKTIAEFVENDEIKGMLESMGIDYAQGFSIGQPQPVTQLLTQSVIN